MYSAHLKIRFVYHFVITLQDLVYICIVICKHYVAFFIVFLMMSFDDQQFLYKLLKTGC